jgi:hypothetical protein
LNQQLGLTEFFAMEASDYLERLDALVSPPTLPDPNDFVRLTRALRGSALMARQSTIAAAAAAFEKFARRVKEEEVWDEATRQRAVAAVDGFKILVRKVGSWGEAEDHRAKAIMADLAPETTSPPETAGPSEGGGVLDAGARAFVGREGAAVASALAQAAKSLQQNPRGFDPVHRVLVIAQPLRGLSTLSVLPPLEDLLEGVERAVTEIVTRPNPLPESPILLDAAAKAVARAARELANDGRADPEAVEARRFVALLSQLFEGALVPVESLYYDDGGPHIVRRGAVPGRRRVLGHVELVSHGEHLLQAAHALEQSGSLTQSELRAQSLTPTFRALMAASGSPVLDAVSQFAIAARDAVARGAAVMSVADFVARLREAGHVLVDAATGDEDALATQLRAATAVVETLGAPVPQPAHAPEPAQVLKPKREPAPQRRPAATPRGDEAPDLAGSWARYERLVETAGLGAMSLDEMLAAPGAATETAEAGVEEETPASEPAVEASRERGELVSIMDLCYSGRAALARAASLRTQIVAQLSAGTASEDLRDLIEEVLDLVDLGLRN